MVNAPYLWDNYSSRLSATSGCIDFRVPYTQSISMRCTYDVYQDDSDPEYVYFVVPKQDLFEQQNSTGIGQVPIGTTQFSFGREPSRTVIIDQMLPNETSNSVNQSRAFTEGLPKLRSFSGVMTGPDAESFETYEQHFLGLMMAMGLPERCWL